MRPHWCAEVSALSDEWTRWICACQPEHLQKGRAEGAKLDFQMIRFFVVAIYVDLEVPKRISGDEPL